MPSATASTESIKLAPSIDTHNAVALSRILSNQDLSATSICEGVCTVYPFFSSQSGNLLGEFQLEFPKYRTARIDYELLNDVLAGICKLRRSIDSCPEYLAIMGMFGKHVMGGLPQLEFAFDNHYLEIKPYALNHLGWPNMHCVLALGHGPTTRNTRRFVNPHLHRVGSLASQWLCISGYLAPKGNL